MHALWVIAAYWSLALAAPEAGYSYPSPANSHSFGGNSVSISAATLLASSGYSPSVDNSLSFGGHSQSFGGHSQSFGGNSLSSGGYYYPAPTLRPEYGPPPKKTSRPGGSDELLQTSTARSLTGKSEEVYVYGGGEQPDTTPSPGRGGGGITSPRKVHYKIVFIKAPSYQTQAAQAVQIQARDEHKTLIYVLVKKPEDAAALALPTAAPTAPSKPEVYFIRYKARAQAVDQGGDTATGTSYGVPGRTGGPY